MNNMQDMPGRLKILEEQVASLQKPVPGLEKEHLPSFCHTTPFPRNHDIQGTPAKSEATQETPQGVEGAFHVVIE